MPKRHVIGGIFCDHLGPTLWGLKSQDLLLKTSGKFLTSLWPNFPICKMIVLSRIIIKIK